jgi:type II secretory pathway pseudopilin PulG
MNYLKRERGYTFLEIILAGIVLAIITVGVVVLFRSAMISWHQGQVKNILERNASHIILNLTRDLKKAFLSSIKIDNYPDKNNSNVQRIKFRSSVDDSQYVYYVPDRKYDRILCMINGKEASYSPLCPRTKGDKILIKNFKFKLASNCRINLELWKYLEGVGKEKYKSHKVVTTVSIKVK